jgi:hypothetical protein
MAEQPVELKPERWAVQLAREEICLLERLRQLVNEALARAQHGLIMAIEIDADGRLGWRKVGKREGADGTWRTGTGNSRDS